MIRILQLLLLLVLAAIAWRLVKQWLAPPPPLPGEPPKFEPTGRCARCGTYVPREQLDGDGVCPRCRT